MNHRARIVLIVCLLLSAALNVFLLSKRPHTESATGPTTTAQARSETRSSAAGAPTNPVQIQKLDWSSIQSESYRTYINNLRDIKCPEATIRDIIVADVTRVYAAKRRAIKFPAVANSFLIPDSKLAKLYQPQMDQVRALEQEKRYVLRTLLGIDGSQALTDQTPPPEKTLLRLCFLPEEKRDVVLAVLNKYNAEQESFSVGQLRDGKTPNPADLQEIKARQEKELKTFLTPDEYEQYLFGFHYRGNNLRTTLYGFNPTADEFRFVFNLLSPVDDKYEFYDISKPQWQNPRLADLAPMNEIIHQHFGDQRFAEYMRCWSPEYKGIRQLVETYDLAPDVSTKVYDVNQATRKDLRVVQADASLSPEDRQNKLAEIKAKSDEALKGLLGDQAFAAYRSK